MFTGVAENVPAAMHHIAQVNADPKLDRLGSRPGISLLEGMLDLDRALDRFQRTTEFHKKAITQGLDRPSSV